MVKSTEMTMGQARELIQKCFVSLIAEQEAHGGFKPQTNELDFEYADQSQLSQDRMTELKSQIETHKYDVEVQNRVRTLLAESGRGTTDITEARLTDLQNGVARALVEQQRLFLLRLEDRLAAFIPNDDLFKQEAGNLTSMTPIYEIKGPSLGYVVERYLDAHKPIWTLKTYKARVWQLGYFVEFVGNERPIASIKTHDVRQYRDAVLALRANHSFQPSQSFSAKQTESLEKRINSKTAEEIFKPLRAMLNWAVSKEGYLEASPAQAIKFIHQNQKHNGNQRRPFNAKEIEQLFSFPLFTGCKSAGRRNAPGDLIIKDGKFWLPILGYYTGCRLGELVQLAIEDFGTENGLPFLDINERPLFGGEKKSVKSKAGLRKVPLHSDLSKLGFLEFVAKRRKQDAENIRLFKEIKCGADGQASTEYSKIFGRLKRDAGLVDPELVFHSFRHGAVDALRDAKLEQHLIDRIIGHQPEISGGKYGKGASIEVLSECVNSMKLPVSLPDFFQSKQNWTL